MPKILGIDLGTSTSEVAALIDDKPFIIPNGEGKAITPSAVHIARDGSVIVGEEAAALLLLEPESTFVEVKRLFGQDQTLRAHGVEYSPEKIQSFLLGYLRECAEKHFGETIDRAVITVPAYFSDKQRRQTVQAGLLAGLTVERIINEPTAAALDFGLAHKESIENILVYDFGGGTLDITVLELFEGVIDVKSSQGNNALGGKDFDAAIVDWIIQRFPAKSKADIRKDMRAMMRLRQAAQEAKITLSGETEYSFALPFLFNGQSFDDTLSRAEFEGLIAEKADSTEIQLRGAVKDAGLAMEDISRVLLVGGTTRIPYIARLVERITGKTPDKSSDPDLAVVRGAAIQAGIIEGELAGEMAIADVCPFTLGTAVLEISFMPKLVYDPIIPRNTTIPVSKSKIYYTVADNQTSVNVRVYQGEYTKPENNEHLGEFMLEGIPPARAGKEAIEVTFSYDINSILQISARIISTGKAASITIATAGMHAAEPVNIDDWANAKNAKKYRPLLRKAERLVKADSLFSEEIEQASRLLKEALLLENSEEIEEYAEDLKDLLEDAYAP